MIKNGLTMTKAPDPHSDPKTTRKRKERKKRKRRRRKTGPRKEEE